jgi:hypothetical protein
MQVHLSVNPPPAMVEQQGVCAPSRAPDASGAGGAKKAARSYFAWGCFRSFVF